VRLAGAALGLGLLLSPCASQAEEWHEAYRAGIEALARGDAARAAGALRRAIALHPEPGRNVVTYGTNLEPRYFPYLRLAEACLAQGQLDAAREALQRSAAWGDREPAADREKLLARLEAARAPQPASPPAAPQPTAAAPPASTLPLPPPSANVALETPAPVPTPMESPRAEPPRVASSPASEAQSPAPAPPAPPSRAIEEPSVQEGGRLEIVSRPPGASAYLDDQPLGTTDPQTGRLLKTELAPGRHRVRVALDGHADLVREIDVPSGGSAIFDAALSPRAAATSAAPRVELAVFSLVAIGVVAVLVWISLQRPAEEAAPRTTTAPGKERFGEFRLLDLLGRGGMATVYRAERRGEIVALKRPLPAMLDDPEFRERFLREAEIGRTLNHPNIIRILERGAVGDVPYFTMELLAGETLQAVLKRGAVEPRAAAAAIVQVAEALDFAHSKGVVHRDLKPSNVMLLRDGTVKVMDFGIARAHRFEGLTATAAFLGTPDYVAPEMAEGLGSEPRSDLYALGLVFFELLTGRRPFSAETPLAVLKKHASEEPPLPSRVRPGVPPELEAIVLRLLKKRPEERPASAEELVIALRDWLNRAAA
jgi:tRNA A-37 threonylcarbamoyl transferase component Bud32